MMCWIRVILIVALGVEYSLSQLHLTPSDKFVGRLSTGDNYYVECSGMQNIKWYNPIGNEIKPKPSSNRVYIQKKSKTAVSLSLNDITEDMSGVYGCSATSNSHKYYANFTLEVPRSLQITYLTLSPSDTVTEKYRGNDYFVKCNGTNTEKTKWLDPKGNPITDKDTQSTYVDRIGLENGLNLIFKNITKEHNGTYTCVGTVNQAQESIKFDLKVLEPISFKDPKTENYVKENESIVLRCEVDGDPAPFKSWYFNQKNIEGVGKYNFVEDGLYVKNITQEDEGIYVCTASQVTPHTSDMKALQLDLIIEREPEILNTQENDEIYGYNGSLINITCRATGKPPPNFIWTMENRGLLNRFTNNIISGTNESILQVQFDVSLLNNQITCIANNSMGNDTKNFTLVEANPPKKVSTRHVFSDSVEIDVECDQTGLTFRVEIIKADQINNTNNESAWFGANVFNFTARKSVTEPLCIHNLSSSTEYLYRVGTCTSEESCGFSPIYHFTTSPLSTNSAPTIVWTMFSQLLVIIPAILIRKLEFI